MSEARFAERRVADRIQREARRRLRREGAPWASLSTAWRGSRARWAEGGGHVQAARRRIAARAGGGTAGGRGGPLRARARARSRGRRSCEAADCTLFAQAREFQAMGGRPCSRRWYRSARARRRVARRGRSAVRLWMTDIGSSSSWQFRGHERDRAPSSSPCGRRRRLCAADAQSSSRRRRRRLRRCRRRSAAGALDASTKELASPVKRLRRLVPTERRAADDGGVRGGARVRVKALVGATTRPRCSG